MTPKSAATVGATDALIFPPPGGPAILNVVETDFPNAVRQDIWLATDARTPGENKITVTLFKGEGGDGSDARLKDTPLVAIDLAQEARTAWPGADMRVSDFYVQNDYGPFGYAAGRSPAGDTCIYAWQRIKPALKPSGATQRGPVSIRLQLCDRARSEQSLLNVMYQLRVNAPVFEPMRASPQIGRIAAPMRPVGVAGFAETSKPVATPVHTVVTPAPSPRPEPAPVVQPVAAAVPPDAPIVPKPPASGEASPQSGSVTDPAVIVPPPPAEANP